MIRIAIALALASIFALPAEARGLKFRLPPPVQHIEKYVPPIGQGIGRSFRGQSDCGAAPTRPCVNPEVSPWPEPR